MPQLTLVYHCIGDGKYQNLLETFEQHLAYIHKHYGSILPGENISRNRLGVMLSFDDAYFSFYHFIYPLLKKYQLRALVAVSPKYIIHKSTLSANIRLSVPFSLRSQEGVYENKHPFCTWEELGEMVDSGLIQVASHGYVHGNLQFSFMDLYREVVQSKEKIQQMLHQEVSSFVYPFGKYAPVVHQYVQKHYTYSFRIGGGLNWSWESKRAPLLRVPADRLESPTAPFSLKAKLSYLIQSLKTPTTPTHSAI